MVAVVAAILLTTASAQPVGESPQATGGRPAPVPDSQGRLLDVFLLGDSQAFGLRSLYGEPGGRAGRQRQYPARLRHPPAGAGD